MKGKSSFRAHAGSLVLLLTVHFFTICPVLHAQNLGWEGETGVFVTPTAYTIATPKRGFALPVASYHYLNGGDVLGTFSQLSVTSGYANRLEFGYTRDFHAEGDDASLSPLWKDGFNTFHAKGVLIRENAWHQPWMPSVATGFMVRSQVRNVGGALTQKDTTNGDVYLALTKTISQLKPMPILLTGGVRGTNSQLWGLGGNAPDWGAYAFGNAAFILQGPVHSTVILAAEVAQQPHHPDQLPEANIRTTMVYAMRVLPSPKMKLNVDFGILEGPGQIAPGTDLKAKDRPAFAITYAF